MTQEERQTITDFSKCDFREICAFFERHSSERKKKRKMEVCDAATVLVLSAVMSSINCSYIIFYISNAEEDEEEVLFLRDARRAHCAARGLSNRSALSSFELQLSEVGLLEAQGSARRRDH